MKKELEIITDKEIKDSFTKLKKIFPNVEKRVYRNNRDRYFDIWVKFCFLEYIITYRFVYCSIPCFTLFRKGECINTFIEIDEVIKAIKERK